ncbi:MAG: putative immunity protein [Patescibacteria group bacterium]
MKKYCKSDQKLLVIWAADCAERVLPLFENKYPEDKRPRQAIEILRNWIKTGVFQMNEIRGASLAAHAAARKVKDDSVACFAARAAGQAAATAHVSQHAYGSAYYALKAIITANPTTSEEKVNKEYAWQSRHLHKGLRQEIMNRIIISPNKKGIVVKINKGDGF